ncbi:MAG: VanZ family protein [Planctomycetota bacterium]
MDAAADVKEPGPAPSRTWAIVRAIVGVLGLGLWVWSVVKHDAVGLLFAQYFEYARVNWGPNGRQLGEQRLFLTIGVGAVVFALGMLAKLLASKPGRAALPEALARWGVSLLCCLAANRYLICIQSESVHFAQFALFAFLIGIATKNARLAFLVTVFLGFLDELHQYWFIYWGEIGGRLDWTDMCLDACGASLGALPVTTFARVRRHESGRADEPVAGTSAQRLGWAVFLLGVAGLVVVVLGWDLGHYPHQRPWETLDNRKPFHTLGTQEGVAAVLALTFLLYFVVDERRRSIPIHALLAALVAWHLGLRLPPRFEGEPIHEKVPTAEVPRAKAAITIDGDPTEAEWAGAARVELHGYAPDAAVQFAGVRGEKLREMASSTLGPELETKARLLWDDRALYVAFECATTDAWARDFARDDANIASSPCVEVFLDTDAAERAYYEFEVSAANRVQDLYVYWPTPPQWIPAPTMGEEFVGLPGWDSKRLETAVKVQGELDVVPVGSATVARALPPSRGYSVEIAIPWADMKGRALGLEQRPVEGARLRANLYRVEPRRPDGQQTTFLCWAPTHAPLTFHRPAFFGQLVLVK